VPFRMRSAANQPGDGGKGGAVGQNIQMHEVGRTRDERSSESKV
jgi:hypothetical protein